MQRAQRFDNRLHDEYMAFANQLILDDEIAYALSQEQAEREYFDEPVVSDRVRWLMDNKDMSLVEAAEFVAEEDRQWAEDTFRWLHDPKNFDSEIYSDIYKEYYGVRPHGYRPSVVA